MSNRSSIKAILANFFGGQDRYISVELDEKDEDGIERERKYFAKFIKTSGRNNEISVSKEKGRGLLWFWRRKQD